MVHRYSGIVQEGRINVDLVHMASWEKLPCAAAEKNVGLLLVWRS